jgi:hypothetical protein
MAIGNWIDKDHNILCSHTLILLNTVTGEHFCTSYAYSISLSAICMHAISQSMCMAHVALFFLAKCGQ